MQWLWGGGGMTKEQQGERLLGMRSALKKAANGDASILAAADWKDKELEKWLIARSFDVDAATTMLVNHLHWIRDEKIDSILTKEYFHTSCMEAYVAAFRGKDNDGNPVYYEFPGKCDPVQLSEGFPMEFLLRWHLAVMETGKKLVKDSGADGVTVVMDMAGASMQHRSLLHYIRAIGKLDSDNYPEHLRKLFILNTNVVVRSLFALAAPFFDARTREKIVMLGGPDQYLPELAKHMPLSTVPAFLGGDGEDLKFTPFGAPRAAKGIKVWMPTVGELEQLGAVMARGTFPESDRELVDRMDGRRQLGAFTCYEPTDPMQAMLQQMLFSAKLAIFSMEGDAAEKPSEQDVASSDVLTLLDDWTRASRPIDRRKVVALDALRKDRRFLSAALSHFEPTAERYFCKVAVKKCSSADVVPLADPVTGEVDGDLPTAVHALRWWFSDEGKISDGERRALSAMPFVVEHTPRALQDWFPKDVVSALVPTSSF